MKKLLPLILFFSLLIKFASSQTPEITGIVIDVDTKEPLIGVSVLLEDSTGTTTDVAGKYRMQIPIGPHELTFRYIGYAIYKTRINLKDGQALIVNAALKNSSKELNTVVISASKFEQKLNEVVVSMSVISPQFIQNTNKVDMEEAMDQVPGVTVIDQQANIRGGSGFSYGAGSRVLVLVDEMPMLAADASDVKWSFLPLESMSQIEVIKGASSVLFGSSAMNGVINMRTKYPTSKPETMVEMYCGLYDIPKYYRWYDNKQMQMESGTNFNHSQQYGRFDLVVGGQVFKDDGYREAETEQRYRMNVSMRYRFKKVEGLSVVLRTNVQQAKGGLFLIWQNDTTGALVPLGGMDTATTTISYYTTTRYSIDNEWSYFSKKGAIHKLKGRYFETINKNNTNQQSTARAYFSEYDFQKKFADIVTVTSGIVYQYNKVKSELYGDHNSSNIAGYAQADLKYERWNVSVGGRIEGNKLDTVKGDPTPVFRTGVNYRLTNSTNMRASYGQGYRYPSIAEKFVRTEVGDIIIYPNDSITSESGWSGEIGVQQGFKLDNFKGYLDVAAFVNRYHNMMEFTFGPYGDPLHDPLGGFGFKSVNIGNTKISGIDVTLAGDGNIGLTPISMLMGYTYIDPIYTDFDSASVVHTNSTTENILKYRYKHMFKGDMQVGIGKFSIGASTRYFSHMDNIDWFFEFFIPGIKHYRDNHLKGDWVFDGRLSYKIDKNISFAFLTKNIFNHIYVMRPADMQPVRSFHLQVVLNY
ncbi:MAG: TonB-dependent receptor [Bacteroidia bacterium]